MTRFIARLLVGVLVFAQVTLAAYACPMMPNGSMGGAGHAVRMSMPAGPGVPADGGMSSGSLQLDPSQPNLCAAHCESGQQNVDGKSALMAPAALLTSFYTVMPLAPRAAPARAPAWATDPPPSADPPHTIAHCCLRI